MPRSTQSISPVQSRTHRTRALSSSRTLPAVQRNAIGIKPPSPLPLSKQYNAQRISLKLRDIGTDHDTANRVAKIVQDYALRWNVRHRKKQCTHNNQDYDNIINEQHLVSIFDVDEVISVMTEYGLDGDDIANVFEQTPSVAMIKARSDDGGVSEEMCKALIHVIRAKKERRKEDKYKSHT